MPNRQRRITLIANPAHKPSRDWNYAGTANASTAFLESIEAVRFALTSAVLDAELDIERVIVDRTGTAAEYLDLVAGLPLEFNGDVLLIDDDDSGFLSATARGGDRVLYALNAHDFRFYLEAHDLVTGRIALQRTETRGVPPADRLRRTA
jgi:hypothetical protein